MLTLTREDLNAIAEIAAERGAKKALASIGLHDERAADDVRGLRDLLSVYRSIRTGAATTLGRAVMWVILVGAGIYVAGQAKILTFKWPP